MKLNLGAEELLVSGDVLGRRKSDCYLTIFPNKKYTQTDSIIIGNNVL